ncbi:MAG: HRDC domain-containing protein [Planctomycetes bacterium]|nr:HRDC domain-containing protein [Planctomycetota bacterium]
MSQSPPKVEIITQADRLEAICKNVRSCGWFAFDTEFVGEDQFKPELCLIQIACDDWCALVDPLSGLDVSPVWELVADEKVLVIVHSGSEDIAQCWDQIGKQPMRVFDSQVAAGFVSTDYPISLSRLALSTNGQRIHKSQTLSNWRQRPLANEQLKYAVEDVIHLRPIYEHIDKRLNALRRTAWMWEECDGLCRAASEPDGEEQKLRRLRGAGSLEPRELAIAYELVDAREQIAKQYNRPARVVLKDHLLVEIAKRGWTDIKKMQTLRGINLSAAALHAFSSAIERAKKLPPSAWPELPSQEDSPQEQVIISLLTAVLTDYCSNNQLAYGLLSKKQSLRAFVRGFTRPNEPSEEHPFGTGWRHEAVGTLLEGLLTGTRAIRIASPDAGRLNLKIE